MYIGGLRNVTTGLYYWDGLLTHAMPLYGEVESDWREVPRGNDCINLKYSVPWNDFRCTSKYHAVCERYFS